jgi:hypothetical protein
VPLVGARASIVGRSGACMTASAMDIRELAFQTSASAR